MKIGAVFIANFRSFDELTVDLERSSRLLIGENAIGKSSFIIAIARALGKDTRNFRRNDFGDLARAIEIRITLSELDSAQAGVFADAADFGATTTLTIGVTVTWDPDTEELDVTHGYPTKNWRVCTKVEREALDVCWITDTRDPSQLLQLGWRKSIIGDLFSQLDLASAISDAIGDIKAASDGFAASDALAQLLSDAGDQLSSFVPGVGTGAYTLEAAASTELSLLRQLQLSLSHGGRELPLENQSSGLAQLTLFAFSMLTANARSGCILLIDEPELALHPQCQRALLAALDALPNQYVAATHSASILDRADPRRIVRLHRDGNALRAARPSTLTDVEATTLARFTTARNAEAFFARTAILVEGDSDRFAIESLARKKARNFDAEGISIVVMNGAGGIKTFSALLGPNGLRVGLAGLCDADKQSQWVISLKAHGIISGDDQDALAASGFFVNDPDLEYVLIDAIGEQRVLALITTQGELEALERFARQPAHAAKLRREQLHDFLHSRGRQVIYAPLLIDLLNLASLPPSLEGLINAV